MSSCDFSGNADMYGLGIRVGFYLQWYGTILASWIARREVPALRLSNSLFITASFLALIIQVDRDNLRPSEIYIVLLLTFGSYLYFVPLYIWRALTCFQPVFDPSRYPRVAAGPIYSLLNFILLLAVSLFQLWFWFERVSGAKTFGCQEYGFFFARVRLDQRGFVVGNILLHFFILFVCLIVLAGTVVRIMRRSWLREIYDDHGSTISSDYDDEINITKVRETALQELNTFIQLLVASIVLAATELTISWNGIKDVNEITTAGQTIPMVIGIGLLVRVVYINLLGDLDERYRIRNGPINWLVFPESRIRGTSSVSGFSSRT